MVRRFALDLAQRLPARLPGNVLEIACGTGLVTRRLREHLDPASRLFASDISKVMLDYARNKLVRYEGIEWREADAASLPFGGGEFSAVVCAFGVMLFPTSERYSGRYVGCSRVVESSCSMCGTVWRKTSPLQSTPRLSRICFPGIRRFNSGTPYEMHDLGSLQRLLEETGFREERIEKKQVQVGGVSARRIALGQIRGTPRSLLHREARRLAGRCGRKGTRRHWREQAGRTHGEVRRTRW